jgi:ATP-binding cassette subfamily F protein uup
MRGDRLGIIGNNGVGKSTLLRILLGELTPDSGTVKIGTNVVPAYFDQLRREIDPTKTVAEFIGEGRDYVTIAGHRKHVVSYLTDFLFSAKRAMTSIAALSGGERNRLLLAKLFTRPANLLILDEPTNDLDIETLEALEERIAEYDGTLIVVSHDRHFLDAVVTATLVFEAAGRVVRHAGGYSDWLERHERLATADTPDAARAKSSAEARSAETPTRSTAAPRKLSYKLQRELDALPDEIERIEQRVAAAQAAVTAADFYRQPSDAVQRGLAELSESQRALESAVERWAELEQQAAALSAEPPAR